MSQNAVINQLIKKLSRLPGLGGRSAKRIALHLLTKSRADMLELAQILELGAQSIKPCSICHNLTSEDQCDLCLDPGRDQTQICVVRDVSDLWALERTKAYKGLYHILGGVLSALDGVGPSDLDVEGLLERSRDPKMKEVIIALDATVDGQTTAHYITERLKREGLEVTRLAQGVPIGGDLDYLDDGTLATALKSRAGFSSNM
jgi:recombination protein RecR